MAWHRLGAGKLLQKALSAVSIFMFVLSICGNVVTLGTGWTGMAAFDGYFAINVAVALWLDRMRKKGGEGFVPTPIFLRFDDHNAGNHVLSTRPSVGSGRLGWRKAG